MALFGSISDLRRDAGKFAREASDTVSERARDARDTLAPKLRDARDTLGARARAAGSSAGDYADDARAELSGLWTRIEDLVSRRGGPALASGRDLVEDYAQVAGDRVSSGANWLAGAVRQRPLVAIGIAVAATWLITRLLDAPAED